MPSTTTASRTRHAAPGGNGCLTSAPASCQAITSLPGAAANIQAQQQKISDDLKPFKYYPELSVMFGWSFS